MQRLNEARQKLRGREGRVMILKVSTPSDRTEHGLAGKDNIVIDFLHVIAVIEHAKQFFKQAQIFSTQTLACLRKKSDFLDFQLEAGERFKQGRLRFVELG